MSQHNNLTNLRLFLPLCVYFKYENEVSILKSSDSSVIGRTFTGAEFFGGLTEEQQVRPASRLPSCIFLTLSMYCYVFI